MIVTCVKLSIQLNTEQDSFTIIELHMGISRGNHCLSTVGMFFDDVFVSE